MALTELLQRYVPHNDFTRNGKDPNRMEGLNCKQPTMAKPDPTPCFDAKTKLLHNMLDKAVKDLASKEPEPASEWEGTLWRCPGQPKPRSPTYSDISDSYELPAKIDHCINNLLSTPISAASAAFKGPDGWPLGVEVAMNDFHRGVLSTPIVQEKELPNPLILRKKKARVPLISGKGNAEGQELADCRSVHSGKDECSQDQQEIAALKPLAFGKEQSSACSQQGEEGHDHGDSAGHESLASQEQSCMSPRAQNEGEQQNHEEKEIRLDCVPILSARKLDDDGESRGNASSGLHPAVAQGKEPIKLGLASADIQPPTSHIQTKDRDDDDDGSRFNSNAACLSYKDRPRTASSHLPPHSEETSENLHETTPEINAFADAHDEKPHVQSALAAFEESDVEDDFSDQIGCQNTFESSENNTIQGIRHLTSEDSEAHADTDILTWITSGPLDDILEESEDAIADTVLLEQGQPQHFTPGSAEPFNSQKSNGAGETQDITLPLPEPQIKTNNLVSGSPRVPSELKLTISPSTKAQYEMAQPTDYRRVDAKSSEAVLSDATIAMLKDPNRKKGCLSAAALAEMRKTAQSQQHFKLGPNSPKDQDQAHVHPLLRSTSLSRSSVQPSKAFKDFPLKYVFKDDDSESEENEGDSFSDEITNKPQSLPQPEDQDSERFITESTTKEHVSSQISKMAEDAVPRYLCIKDGTEAYEAENMKAITAQRSTLRASRDTTLVPSLGNATPSSSYSRTSRGSAASIGSPYVMSPSICQPSESLSRIVYCSNSAIRASAPYNSWATTPYHHNSWASTPHHHEHGNSSCTPSSSATLQTSTVPTPNTPVYCNSSTSRKTTVTPSSSFGKLIGSEHASRGSFMTPSSSFGQVSGSETNPCGASMTPSSSFSRLNNYRAYRRSASVSNMLARYNKARYPDLPAAATTDSMPSPQGPVEVEPAKEVTNDPFTSTRETATPSTFNLKTPSKENLADPPNNAADQLHTPTRRTSGRFSLHRRSLSISGRPSLSGSLDRAVSTMLFSPLRNRLHKRRRSTSASIDTTTARPDGHHHGLGHRRSLSVANVDQKWEVAPAPTPLALRDEFSMRYRPEPLEADDHYVGRSDALQGMKQGFRKVFSRK